MKTKEEKVTVELPLCPYTTQECNRKEGEECYMHKIPWDSFEDEAGRAQFCAHAGDWMTTVEYKGRSTKKEKENE